MKINVAIITSGKQPVPPVKGGAVEIGIQQIIEENEKQEKINLTVFSKYDKEAEEQSQKYKHIKFEYIDTNKSSILKVFIAINFFVKCINKLFERFKINFRFCTNSLFIKAVIEKILVNDFNLVLVKNIPDYILPLSKAISIKIILQLHNDYLNKNTVRAKEIYDSCEKIVVVSEYIRQQVLTIKDSDKAKVIINKNCTDINIFNRKHDIKMISNLKNKYGIRENEIVLLFCGRLIKEKGIMELLLSLRLLPKEAKWKLIIVGSHWYSKNRQSRYINELKKLSSDCNNKIIFAGYIPYNKLSQIYSITDVSIIPSIWEEPAGRVVIEAEASGLPVIVTDAGGICDYINSKSALVVKRDSKLIENLSKSIFLLISDNEYRKNMAKQAYRFGQEFTPERYYNEFIEIIM